MIGSGDERTDRDRLRELLRERSLRRGDFVLASGRRSSYYIDARVTTMSGRGQALIGRVGLALLDSRGWTPASVGGLTMGADPVAFAIAHAATLEGRPVDAFSVRRQPKNHGTGRRIEGSCHAGADIVVVEDVITTGASALEAVNAVTEANAHVLGVLALVDRQEGGSERIAGHGIPVAAVFTISDLLGES